MWFTAVAVAAGAALGLLAGGRPSALAGRTPRHWWILLVGVALQGVPEATRMTEAGAFPFVLASYAALLVFGLLNLRVVGMTVVMVGLALNVAVIAPNGGMPVRAEAMRAVGFEGDPEALDFGAKRHLEQPEDRLTVLGDIIPVRPLGEVLSFGDLVLAAGMANLVFRLLKPRRVANHRLGAHEDEEPVDLADTESRPGEAGGDPLPPSRRPERAAASR